MNDSRDSMSARRRPVWLPFIGFVTFPAMSDAEPNVETDFETGHIIFLSLLVDDEAVIREQYQLANKYEGRRPHLQREHIAAEAMLGDVATRRERVLAENGELRVFEVDSYQRTAALAGQSCLADAMTYLEGLGHGRFARQRLDVLVAGGHVAADALAPTGWAARHA